MSINEPKNRSSVTCVPSYGNNAPRCKAVHNGITSKPDIAENIKLQNIKSCLSYLVIFFIFVLHSVAVATVNITQTSQLNNLLLLYL